MAFAFLPIMDGVSSVKWHALTSARRMGVPFATLFAYYVIGRFYNLILPSSIGGDVVRVHLLGKRTSRYADAAAIVFIERFTGVVTLVVLAAVALMFASLGFSKTSLGVTIFAAAAVLAGIVWLVRHDEILPRLEAAVAARHRVGSAVASKLEKLRKAIRAFGTERRALVVAMLHSIVFYAAAIVNTWISVRVFDGTVALSDMLIAVPLIMFIMNIPVSMGNLGIMEFGYTVVLMQFGISGEAALAAALLMRLKLLVGGAVGAILHVAMDTRPPDVVATK
jgi:hypothetical protein